jgi:CheY-like chemotaxis protein
MLAALRAAAIVITATGLNDIVGGSLPRYEPLYLYLAAVALVAWLDGFLFGILTAIGVASFYALLFSPRPFAFSVAMLVPLGFAMATAVAVSLVRRVMRPRSRPVPQEMLPVMPQRLTAGPVIVDNAEVLSAIDDLRAELRVTSDAPLRARIAELEEDAAARHTEVEALRARIREAEEATAQARTLAAEQAQTHQATREALQRRIAELVREAAEAREAATKQAQSDESARAALQARAEELERELANVRAAADAHGSARTTLQGRVAELQRMIETARLSAADAERREAEQLAVAGQAQAAREAAQRRAEELERTLAQTIARQRELEAELTVTRVAVGEREAALQERTAELEQERESIRAEGAERLVAALQANDSLEADKRALQERVAELEHGRAEGEAALREELARERAAFDEKLHTIMVHLAADHEADLGKALEEKEEARAEARSLSMRLAALQKRVEEEAQEAEKLRARIAELEKPVVATPRTRILIAHPDADLRMSARASLERAGYEIVSAADGLEALRTAIAQRPAVVIADAIMPKMDGRELCQLLKSQEKTASIRVILLTRATDAPPTGDLLPDEVLRKPVPLETLKSTLAALLATP